VIQKKSIVISVKGIEPKKRALQLRNDFLVKLSNGILALNVYGIDEKC
jgi:ribosomal protein S12